MNAGTAFEAIREPKVTQMPSVRGPLVAVATLADGVWSLAVRLVHPSAGRTVVEVPEVDATSFDETGRWLDLDYALIAVGFYRATGWSGDTSGSTFKASVRRFPTEPVPSWADQRFDVTPCQSLGGDVSVTFEKSFGNAGSGFADECTVYLSQTFLLVEGELSAGSAVVHVHAEAPDLDAAKANEVASWLIAAGALAEQINASLPMATGRAA